MVFVVLSFVKYTPIPTYWLLVSSVNSVISSLGKYSVYGSPNPSTKPFIAPSTIFSSSTSPMYFCFIIVLKVSNVFTKSVVLIELVPSVFVLIPILP